jgi:hypothetical protein
MATSILPRIGLNQRAAEIGWFAVSIEIVAGQRRSVGLFGERLLRERTIPGESTALARPGGLVLAGAADSPRFLSPLRNRPLDWIAGWKEERSGSLSQ